MIVLKQNINMGGFTFDFVNNVEVRSSVDSLTDTATLVIPKKLVYKRNGKVVTNIVEGPDPLFKRGTPIEISSGYDDTVNVIFKGYVSDISPRLPLRFELQDEMFNMKQTAVVNYAKEKLTLKQLLTDILPKSIKFKALDVQLGWIRVKRSTVAGVLDHLKTHYGLTCRFVDGVLYAGLRYITTDPLELNIQEFEFEKNIIDDSDLVYRRSDDMFIKLKAISINDKNEKIEVEVGDDFGDQRTMYFYGLSQADLKKIATENLSKLKYEGFYGSFETFLQPQVRAGDAVRMINQKLPEKNGVYLVKEVVTTAGVDGGRQVISLDRKVA